MQIYIYVICILYYSLAAEYAFVDRAKPKRIADKRAGCRYRYVLKIYSSRENGFGRRGGSEGRKLQRAEAWPRQCSGEIRNPEHCEFDKTYTVRVIGVVRGEGGGGASDGRRRAVCS